MAAAIPSARRRAGGVMALAVVSEAAPIGRSFQHCSDKPPSQRRTLFTSNTLISEVHQNNYTSLIIRDVGLLRSFPDTYKTLAAIFSTHLCSGRYYAVTPLGALPRLHYGAFSVKTVQARRLHVLQKTPSASSTSTSSTNTNIKDSTAISSHTVAATTTTTTAASRSNNSASNSNSSSSSSDTGVLMARCSRGNRTKRRSSSSSVRRQHENSGAESVKNEDEEWLQRLHHLRISISAEAAAARRELQLQKARSTRGRASMADPLDKGAREVEELQTLLCQLEEQERKSAKSRLPATYLLQQFRDDCSHKRLSHQQQLQLLQLLARLRSQLRASAAVSELLSRLLQQLLPEAIRRPEPMETAVPTAAGAASAVGVQPVGGTAAASAEDESAMAAACKRGSGSSSWAAEILMIWACSWQLQSLFSSKHGIDEASVSNACCELLLQGGLHLLRTKELALLLLLLGRIGSCHAAFAAGHASLKDKEQQNRNERQRQLLVTALGVFCDRARMYAEVLRRVFQYICSAGASNTSSLGSSNASSSSSTGAVGAVRRLSSSGRRNSESGRRSSLQVTPQEAVQLMCTMLSTRLYTAAAMEALLSRFTCSDVSPATTLLTGGNTSALSWPQTDESLPPAAVAAATAETMTSMASRRKREEAWNIGLLQPSSEILGGLKLVELSLRLDYPLSYSQLSDATVRLLAAVREAPFLPASLLSDTILSYQLAYFLRKHRFPCERIMEGPYPLRLADTRRRLVVMPLEASDEDFTSLPPAVALSEAASDASVSAVAASSEGNPDTDATNDAAGCIFASDAQRREDTGRQESLTAPQVVIKEEFDAPAATEEDHTHVLQQQRRLQEKTENEQGNISQHGADLQIPLRAEAKRRVQHLEALGWYVFVTINAQTLCSRSIGPVDHRSDYYTR